MKIEIEREEDGRWIAEITGLPGVMAYGVSEEDAMTRAETMALRVVNQGVGYRFYRKHQPEQ